jgi:hypothetical protein
MKVMPMIFMRNPQRGTASLGLLMPWNKRKRGYWVETYLAHPQLRAALREKRATVVSYLYVGALNYMIGEVYDKRRKKAPQ